MLSTESKYKRRQIGVPKFITDFFSNVVTKLDFIINNKISPTHLSDTPSRSRTHLSDTPFRSSGTSSCSNSNTTYNVLFHKCNKRQIDIIKVLNPFFPNVITKLISNYDYHLDGKSYKLNDELNMIRSLVILSNERIVVGSKTVNDPKIKIWNIDTGICDTTFMDNSKYGLKCLALLPDNRIVSESYDKTIKIWNIQTGKPDISFLNENNGVLCSIVILPDGQIASLSYQYSLRIYNPQNGKYNDIFDNNLPIYEQSRCIDVLRDGRIVIGTNMSELQIWDIKTGKRDKTLIGHTSFINCVIVLSDGSSSYCFVDRAERIVSGSSDNKLKIWNAQTGKCDITLIGHTDAITKIAELPDGRIVSGSADKTLRIWNLKTGICDMVLQEDHCIEFLAVFPDGRILSKSFFNTIKIWN
jgi:WD40 repeat protein